MAKIRIYELARDLNMTNKTLLEKIQDMDIDAKSHMSALDEETADSIKKKLLGMPEKEVEETRIKPSLIRRRKKLVPETPVKIEISAEPELRPEKIEAVEQTSEQVLEEKELPPEKEPETPIKEEIPEASVVEQKAVKEAEAVDESIHDPLLKKWSPKPKSRLNQNLKYPLL